MEVLLVIWIICGIVAGMIGQSKGRGFWPWFFAGALLGLIGIIIAAAAKQQPEA